MLAFQLTVKQFTKDNTEVLPKIYKVSGYE